MPRRYYNSVLWNNNVDTKFVLFAIFICTLFSGIGLGFFLNVSAEGGLIPSWIKNIAKFWSEGNVGDVEFINAIQYLIQNNIIVLESDNFEEFVSVKGDLFMLLYSKEILKNPTPLAGMIAIIAQPTFSFDDTKSNLYKEIGNLDKGQNAVFIYPTFTQSAYEIGGFYDYYENKCDESCLTTEIHTDLKSKSTSSANAATILHLLGYDFITDMDVDKDPSILKKYDKIILLHNEYVTKPMFEAISHHPKVIYLYPNSLYAEIDVDYPQNAITLIRGHAYPQPETDNGFDWEFDNTRPDEFDTECKDWKFNEISNGIQLNCYPENIIFKDSELLRYLKEY